jgi:hypothetical protein
MSRNGRKKSIIKRIGFATHYVASRSLRLAPCPCGRAVPMPSLTCAFCGSRSFALRKKKTLSNSSHDVLPMFQNYFVLMQSVIVAVRCSAIVRRMFRFCPFVPHNPKATHPTANWNNSSSNVRSQTATLGGTNKKNVAPPSHGCLWFTLHLFYLLGVAFGRPKFVMCLRSVAPRVLRFFFIGTLNYILRCQG